MKTQPAETVTGFLGLTAEEREQMLNDACESFRRKLEAILDNNPKLYAVSSLNVDGYIGMAYLSRKKS